MVTVPLLRKLGEEESPAILEAKGGPSGCSN
jgi:hypothetical protein